MPGLAGKQFRNPGQHCVLKNSGVLAWEWLVHHVVAEHGGLILETPRNQLPDPCIMLLQTHSIRRLAVCPEVIESRLHGRADVVGVIPIRNLNLRLSFIQRCP